LNFKKSLRIAMAMHDLTQGEVATKMGTSNSALSVAIKRNAVTGNTLQLAAGAFNMQVSEFIKLGED